MCKGSLLGPFLSLALLYTLVVLCAISLANGNVYPHWFIFPSEYPNHVVGFSISGTPAINDAEIMYCLYESDTIKGTYYRYNQDDARISDYYHYYSPNCVKEIEGRLIFRSSYVLSTLTNSTIEIYTYPPISEVINNHGDNKSVDNNQVTIIDLINYRDKYQDPMFSLGKNYVDIKNLNMPNWIDKEYWTENDYYYSVGLYTSRGEKNDAWKTAEERAFINLISFTGSLVISYTSLETSGNKKGQIKEYLEQATSNTFDHTIIDGQVMERWPDLQNNLYYVLVRAHKDNIKSSYPNNSGEKTK